MPFPPHDSCFGLCSAYIQQEYRRRQKKKWIVGPVFFFFLLSIPFIVLALLSRFLPIVPQTRDQHTKRALLPPPHFSHGMCLEFLPTPLKFQTDILVGLAVSWPTISRQLVITWQGITVTVVACGNIRNIAQCVCDYKSPTSSELAR